MSWGNDMVDELLVIGRNYRGAPRVLTSEETAEFAADMASHIDHYEAAGTLTQQFEIMLQMIQCIGQRALLQGLDLEEGWVRFHTQQMQRRRGVYDLPTLDLNDLVYAQPCKTCGTCEIHVRRCTRCDEVVCESCVSEDVCGQCWEAEEAS